MVHLDSLISAILLSATVLASCGRGVEGDGLVQNLEDDDVEAADDTISLEADASSDPVEIVYDLTAYDWYRRGEPLIAEDRAYLPAGKPESTRELRLERAGEYGGVTYYISGDAPAPPPTIYVPVSPGYWQPFTIDTAGATPVP